MSCVELAQPRAWCSPSTSTSANPASRTRSASSRGDSSRVWNGLSGVSRPGLKVIRFGVDTSSSPPGRSTRRHSARKPSWSQRCSMTCRDTTASIDPPATGSATRFARATETAG